MKTLWIFGDSFAEHHYHDNQWMRQLKNSLGYNIQAHAYSGSSISHAMHMLNNYIPNFENDDILIVALTNVNRRWFVENDPSINSYFAHNLRANKNQLKAIKYYITYLQNETEDWALFNSFIYNIAFLTEQKNLKTIVLPCFEDTYKYFKEHKFNNIHIANGYMNNIQLNEFDTDVVDYIKQLNQKGEFYDLRLNHMIKSNHTILHNKIMDYLNNGTSLDLTTGFIENYITKQHFGTFQVEFFSKVWEL